jgi:Ca2+-binding EF-hand superfamily protein
MDEVRTSLKTRYIKSSFEQKPRKNQIDSLINIVYKLDEGYIYYNFCSALIISSREFSI